MARPLFALWITLCFANSPFQQNSFQRQLSYVKGQEYSFLKTKLFQILYQESSENMCGSTSWRAANSRSKGRRKLDECGLEVAGCRHAVAQKAVNMFTGEMYAYPHYIQVNFLLPLGVQYLWQDVICKYWPWAKKQACKDDRFEQAVTNMKPALSVMHAKAHQWSCQVSKIWYFPEKR